MLAWLRAASAFLLGATALVAADVRAEPASLDEASTARTQVVLGTIGLGPGSARDSLLALLEIELKRAELSLVVIEPRGPVSQWAAEATRPKRVLAALLLDGRGDESWRVIVIDAARGRAIVRDLPGGLSRDAASIEAVVSIAVSAALALGEGLEIASTPLAMVVDEEAPSDAHPARAETSEAPPRRPARTAWSPRASLGASIAAFSPAVATTEGLSASLGLQRRGLVEARVVGTLFAPARVHGPFGDFRVSRGWLGAVGGPVLGTDTFSIAPELGVMAERLRRFEATPVAGVSATEAPTLYRVGGTLALRLRHTLLRPLSAELVTGAVYFGRKIRFSAKSAGSAWSAETWPALAFAQLGLEVALD